MARDAPPPESQKCGALIRGLAQHDGTPGLGGTPAPFLVSVVVSVQGRKRPNPAARGRMRGDGEGRGIAAKPASRLFFLAVAEPAHNP